MKRKKKNKGVNRILRLVAVFLFLLLTHILINFEGICHLSNWNSYEKDNRSVLAFSSCRRGAVYLWGQRVYRTEVFRGTEKFWTFGYRGQSVGDVCK